MEPAFLVVARFRKLHGLAGAVLVEAMTDSPREVFSAGRALTPVGAGGEPEGEPLVVERGRPFRGGWLLEFRGIGSRTDAEKLTWKWLGSERAELRAPGADQMYVHEIAGAEIVVEGQVIGVARELVGSDGEFLAVEVGGKEHLIPFRRPIVRAIDREKHRIEVDLPPGLLEL